MYCNMNSVFRGWRAVWCDPAVLENTRVKEVVTGPFPSPKIACLLPFFNECQRGCWLQFLKTQRADSKKNSMTRENENLLQAIQNNYGLSIGHGIPDPWISPPYCGMSHSHHDDVTEFLKKFIFQLLETKKNALPCLCCEKKYLFGCPDKSQMDLKGSKNGNSLNCPCVECHGKEDRGGCGDNCNCIKTIKKWVLENASVLKLKNENEPEKEEILSNSSGRSPTRKSRSRKIEIVEPNELQVCNCFTNESSTLKTTTLKTTTTDSGKVPRICSYTPQVSKMNISSSKESQDETSECDLKKPYSRNSSDSYFKECQCFVRCSSCGVQNSRSSTNQREQSGQSTSNHNIPCHATPSHQFSTPVSESFNPSTSDTKKKDKKSEKKKKKEKKKKEKSEVSDSQSKSQDSQLEDSSSLFIGRRGRSSILKSSDIKTSNGMSYATNETSDSRVTYTPPFKLSIDHLKYLTDNKLRRYLQRRELSRNSLSSHQPSLQSITPLSSTFRNLCEGESLSIVALQKCQPFRYCRRETTAESSCDDSRSIQREWPLGSSTRKFNSGAQTSLSIIDEIDSPRNEIPTNVKFFKDVVESDESGICVPLRSYDRTYRENRIRRRLLANRKRRRKLMTKKHWYTAKIPEVAHKIVQANETSEDSINRGRSSYEKRVSFDFDVSEGRSSSMPNPSTLQLLQERSETYCKRLNENRLMRRGNLENVLDKISYNSGTSWSSNTLKNIVDDLMIEKNPKRYMLFDAGIQTCSKNL